MNQTPDLPTTLAQTDMLEVDGLHAWRFRLDDSQPERLLSIEAMDGNNRRQWRFSASQVAAAQYDAASDSWSLDSAERTHRLRCLSGFTRSDADDAD